MARSVDLIIFGASGFTGKHCIPIMHKLSQFNEQKLTWAIAGRNEGKLRAVLQECAQKLETSFDHIDVVVADVSDESSLIRMAARARCILNCCGPYRLYGEAVVKACIEQGTHHVDISGEPQYMETMQLKYNEEARKKGVYVVSACGMDSIPSDLGVIYVQKQHPNIVFNSVETYLEVWSDSDSGPGATINIGTWESAIYGLAFANELRQIRTQLFPKKIPKFTPNLRATVKPHKNEVVDGWIIPFLGSDRSVVRRSQRFIYENDKKRPVQVETYFVVKSIFNLMAFALFGAIFKVMVQFGFGRKLLLKYPAVFSGGYFSSEEPSEKKIEKTHFRITIVGKGWEKSDNDEMEFSKDQKLTDTIIARVKGPNPGYGSTCVCLVMAAIMILMEKDKLPPGGGVYSPGAAFQNTSIIEHLDKNGVNFNIISTSKL